MSRPARLALTAVAVIAVATTASTVTYAAARATGEVSACANSQGTLRLLDSQGRCASGYEKVTIAQQGPAGKPGPGAKTVTIATRGTAVRSASYEVPGTTIKITASCNAGAGGRSSLRLVDPLGVVPFRVVGGTVVDQGDAAAYSTTDDVRTENLSGPVDTFELVAAKGIDQTVGFAVAGTSGRTNAISVQAMVTVGGRSFSLTSYASTSSGRCESTTQVVLSA